METKKCILEVTEEEMDLIERALCSYRTSLHKISILQKNNGNISRSSFYRNKIKEVYELSKKLMKRN